MKRFISCILLTVVLFSGCSCSLDVNSKPVKPKSYKVTSQGRTWVVDDYYLSDYSITFKHNDKHVRVANPYVVEEQ